MIIQSLHNHKISVQAETPLERDHPFALILPGLSYSADHPILMFARLLCQQLNIVPVIIEYAYQDVISGKDEAEILAIMKADAALVEENVFEFVTSDAPFFVLGKSLGCLLMAHMDKMCTRATGTVWFTPNLVYAPLLTALKNASPCFVAMGDKDKYYDANILEQISQYTELALSVQPDLDHGLEHNGDVLSTMRKQSELISDLKKWMESLNR